MSHTSSVGNTEILQVVESISREKGISRDNLITTMEQAIEAVARKKYGHEHNIKAEISRKNGEIKLYRILRIVDNPVNYFAEISLKDGQEKNPEAGIGDEILEPLPPIDLGRTPAHVARQVIIQGVSEVEREKQYQDFKDRKGEIINGSVKRVEFGNIIVDLGRAEAIIKKDQTIRGENYKINDRIKAYIQDVRLESRGPQIFLSRTDNRMLAKLFELEVPEIYDNIIEIKAIAREPGSKAKIAVFASDSSVDPVGSCVGIRGNRVKSVTSELGGEKIDVILWSKNVAQFVINAMAPAEISKIVIDQDKGRVEVVVPTEQLSIAIGRRGQNVRLASNLTRWKIDVMTDEQESKRRSEEFNNTTELFMKVLDVEEVVAQLLSVEGYANIEQIAAADANSLAAIDGFEAELATEIQDRAISYVDSKNQEILEKLEILGVEQELIDVLELAPEHLLSLAEYGVKTIEDLGEVTIDEFKKLVPNVNMSDESIKLLIEAARGQ
ncbi:MAG: transcription termination/antitermination protein NusA [Rickettsiaceae bacterium]|nr:MAG: transcription termination/antitermination protein NusA [Rickettsiaceae bacterium]